MLKLSCSDVTNDTETSPHVQKKKKRKSPLKCFLHAFSKTALSPSFPLAKVTKVT